MAVIQYLKEIENLIPERDYSFYTSPTQCVDDLMLLNNPLFAFIVNKAGRVTNAYRMIFFVQRFDGVFKLAITGSSKNLSEIREYVFTKNDKEPWPFKKDHIGLYLQSESKDGNKVYFGTKINDVHVIRKGVGDDRVVKKTLYLSEVII